MAAGTGTSSGPIATLLSPFQGPAGPEGRRADRWAIAFVLVVLVASTWQALDYVARFGSRVPAQDDLEMACFLVPGWELSWGQLWQAANEHRIVLARLIFLGLLFPTRDFRAPLFFEVWTHAALALAMVLLVRRLRGRTRYADAFFPLFWLNLGNAENFLLGMQIATDLSTVLVCSVLAIVVWKQEALGTGRALALVLCLLLLPLNGGFGLTQVPTLAAWSLVAGVLLWRDRARRRAGAVLLGGLALLAALIAYYFRGLRSSGMREVPFDLGKCLGIAGQFLTLNLGPTASELPWISIPLTAAVAVGAIGLCVRAWRRAPEERWRASLCIAVMLAPFVTGFAIGLGRQVDWPHAGWAHRYVTLPSALFAGAFVVFTLYGSTLVQRTAQGLLFTVFVATAWHHRDYANWYGQWHMEPITNLVLDARGGAGPQELGERYYQRLYNSSTGLTGRLTYLFYARMPPYDHVGPDGSLAAFLCPPDEALGQPILELATDEPATVRKLAGKFALFVHDGTLIRIAVPAGARRVRGSFAVPPGAFRPGEPDAPRTEGLRFRALARTAAGEERELFARALDPVNEEDDRGPQSFEVELPAGAAAIVLRTERRGRSQPGLDWGAWNGLQFE